MISLSGLALIQSRSFPDGSRNTFVAGLNGVEFCVVRRCHHDANGGYVDSALNLANVPPFGWVYTTAWY